ncbi:hypothetical protein B0H10DRAFT_3721 [Mycena sp. CBHHK59/15]|nr:hypothetical protein B0H10DRAFT_3721 [Mycena sp. CBHHK59/15]
MSFIALTYGSFGDIMETARLAKRIIDALRTGVGSYKRQKVISALKGMHDDVVALSTAFDVDSSPSRVQYFANRLSAELALCRSLMERLYAKVSPSSSVINKIWMTLSEEKELASWRIDISERREALYLLLQSLNGVLSCEVGEQLGRVGSQMEHVGSRVHNVETHVQNLGSLTVLGLVASHYLADQVSNVGSQVRQVGSDVQKLVQKTSPHGISDPVFFVVDPLGRAITIQLSYCDGFNDLDRILKAHLYNRPQAGSKQEFGLT